MRMKISSSSWFSMIFLPRGQKRSANSSTLASTVRLAAFLAGCAPTPQTQEQDPGGHSGSPGAHSSGSDTSPATHSTETSSTGTLDTGRDTGAPDLTFDAALFRATHNSYEGGERGSLRTQLDSGVRFIELDVHDDDYADAGYRLGHLWPGDAVSLGSGNPEGERLEDWLSELSAWSADTPGHAPLTLALDLKDDLTDNGGAAAGDLSALGGLLEAAFGSRLVEPAEVSAGWPGVDALRERVLVVLSGDGTTRAASLRETGSDPAVAINRSGQVIEVHSDGLGTLWYWAGQLAEGEVRWLHHGRVTTGGDPAVALNDAGAAVMVFEGIVPGTLWTVVGQLDAALLPAWGDALYLDTGVDPSVRYEDPTGSRLREIHTSPTDPAQRWDWILEIDAEGQLQTGDHGTTSDAAWATDTDTSDAGQVRVFADADGASDANTLLVETDAVARIRFPRRMFVDRMEGEAGVLSEARFASVSAGRASALDTTPGVLTRIWSFSASEIHTTPSFPATETPHAEWVERYCDSHGAVD